MLTPAALRIDFQNTPATIGTLTPSLSWHYAIAGISSGAGVSQTAYRIQVAGDDAFQKIVWDSGFVESAESVAIPWGGPELSPMSRYHARVTARDEAGVEVSWSEPVSFETAAVGLPWDAPIVCPPGSLMPPDASRPAYLRRRFTLDRVPRRPRLLVTALGLYEAWVNGTRVGDDLLTPGWTSYNNRVLYQTYDLSPYLREGENVLGIVLGYGWYAGDITWLGARNLYGDRPGVTAILVDADRVAGSTLAEASLFRDPPDRPDGSAWLAAHGPILSAEIYHGEEYDQRLEIPGWCSPSGGETASWIPCEVHPESATITARIHSQDGPPVRRQGTVPPAQTITTPAGETVLDFGQNLTGWVRINAVGKPGERIVLSHSEVLDRDGNFYTENMRSARNRVAYTIGAPAGAPSTGTDRELFEPRFCFQGFRYVRLDELPEAIATEITDHPERFFSAVVIHSNFTPTLAFSCSDPRLNRLHQNILWGWKGNAVDVPTDCPQRDERLGWTGDAQVFSGTATYLADVHGFFRSWLKDLALEQREDGGVPFVIPDVLSSIAHLEPNLGSTHSSTGWGDAAVICPTILYDRYRDRETLARHYPSMRKWIDFIHDRAEGGVLWNNGFHFGDWVALDAEEGSFFGATPNDLTATAYYAHSVRLTGRAAEILGLSDEARALLDLHDRIVDAFQREFLTPSGQLTNRTQTAHLLALGFSLVRPEHREQVVEDLIALIRENNNHLVTGFLGTPLLLPVLSDNGHLDEAYALLLREEYPSWLYQVARGATTIWEHWDGIKPDGTMWSPQMNSFNHYAYGAVGEWIYRTIGGIDLVKSDLSQRQFAIAPRPGGGLTHADMRYVSVYGPVAVSWNIHNGTLTVRVELPPNTSAILTMPGDTESETIGPGLTERRRAMSPS